MDTEIRGHYIKLFDGLKERVVAYARQHGRDSNLQSPPRASESSKQTKGFNEKGQKRLKPTSSSTSSPGKQQGDKGFKADKGIGDAPR